MQNDTVTFITLTINFYLFATDNNSILKDMYCTHLYFHDNVQICKYTTHTECTNKFGNHGNRFNSTNNVYIYMSIVLH